MLSFIQILECELAASKVVRQAGLRVIQLVLAQGLVHPVQIVPYLISMSTDSEEMIAHSADKQLQVIKFVCRTYFFNQFEIVTGYFSRLV